MKKWGTREQLEVWTVALLFPKAELLGSAGTELSGWSPALNVSKLLPVGSRQGGVSTEVEELETHATT